jgi:hypothetical protein
MKADPLRHCIQEGINWKQLLGRARWHRVLIPLYDVLTSTVPTEVPVDVVEWLQRHYETTLMKNVRATGRLVQILNRFDHERLDVLTFKGPSLATLAYGDVGRREFSDLDLLVRRSDVSRAMAALRSLGFQPRISLEPSAVDAFVALENALEFRRASDGQMVELHWALTPKSFPFRHDLEQIWTSAAAVTVAGRRMPTLSHEQLVLFLCVHAAKHNWESLGWMLDIARLMDSVALDYQQLLQLADRSGTRRILLLGLLLAHDLLKAPLPADVAPLMAGDPRVHALAATVRAHVGAETRQMMATRQQLALHWSMRERLRDRVSYSVHVALTPTVRDLEVVKLPPYLSILHRPMRPFRLMRDLARRSRPT